MAVNRSVKRQWQNADLDSLDFPAMPGPKGGISLNIAGPEALSTGQARGSDRLVRGLRSLSPVDLAITALFAIILVVQIAHHDMWRDEIHSWGLVRASPSLADLYRNLRFTGHPALW